MKKRLLTLAAVGLAAMMTMSAYVYAATPQEVIGKAQGSYTAGTNSVYGSKLNQDQLNAVANVASDFATNYVNSSMDNDAKIRAGYNYIKNNVTYVDWRETSYANTAYAVSYTHLDVYKRQDQVYNRFLDKGYYDNDLKVLLVDGRYYNKLTGLTIN